MSCSLRKSLVVLLICATVATLAGCGPTISRDATEFFGDTAPSIVAIPAEMQGEPDQTYEVLKFDFKSSSGKNIKLYYTITIDGLIGEMYVDGLNLNTTITDTNDPVYLTRDEYIKKIIACGKSFDCAQKVMAQLVQDCKDFRDAKNCWSCEKFGGFEECDWL